MIATEDGGYTTVGTVVWRRCLGATQWLIGRDWRRVFTLALGVLVLGVVLVMVADDQVWDEVGSGLIGGSVVGLVFAIAQHTLDLQAVERQVAHEVRLTVSSSGDLEGIDLAGSDLSEVHLLRKQLRYAHLDGARLVDADLRASDMSWASLRGADLRRADLRGSSLAYAVLDGADLAGAEVPADGLTDARLVGAVLTGARLAPSSHDGPHGPVAGDDGRPGSWRVDLSGAKLDDARLARVALPEVRASFVSARRADAAGAMLYRADLSCADLQGASLSGADLREADLSGADLRGAVMSRADLRGALLVGARLERADLTGAVVDGADLRAADLTGAYLTNVDLAATHMDGARVRAEDLAPTETGPDPATRALRAEPSGHEPASGTAVDVLVLVAPDELGSLAGAVAARLRARRAGLERVNGNLDGIHLREESPYAGEAADHGLPRSVAVRRPPRRATRVWAELRPAAGGVGGTGGVEVVVHRPAGRAVAVGPEPADDGRLASAIQAALADREVFGDADEVHAFATWLERPEAPLGPALAEVLDRNPRNPVALLLRAFARESSDVQDMAEASDEVRTVWAVSRSEVARALAAGRLAWAQGQVLHRASDSAPVLARSRSAADAALRLFDGLEPRRWRRPRSLLVLRTKAEIAWALSRVVTEEPDDLQAGIVRLRRCARMLEARGLTVSPRIRNTLAYCLMAAAGRFTPGPGAGYTEAIDHLRQLLAYYGLREESDTVGAARGTTVSVRTLARRAAAGKGPPADRLLRERSLRLGLVNLGNMHRLEKRFDAALDCYGAAIYCDPSYVEAYAERAWVHLERGDRRSADADIRRALARQVGTPQQKARILVGYVDALERVGLEAEQGPWLDEARRRDPDNPRIEALAQRWRERFGGTD